MSHNTEPDPTRSSNEPTTSPTPHPTSRDLPAEWAYLAGLRDVPRWN